MVTLKVASKVTPVNVPTPKKNNLMTKGVNIVRHVKFIIFVEAFLGINRIYLLKHKIMLWFGYFNSLFLVLLILYFSIVRDFFKGVYIVYKDTSYAEYLLLSLSSAFFQKKTFEKLFRNLANFDEMLNITKDIAVTSSVTRAAMWMCGSVIYTVVEYIMMSIFIYKNYSYSMLVVYLAILTHDSEQIYFCTLLRTILMRVYIMKAHVTKAFSVNEKETKKKMDSVEALSKNAKLDTTAMHRAYELLHKCSEQLNSVMSFPMIVMLFASGLSTVLLLKNVFQMAQASNWDPSVGHAMIVYASVRCIKYTILVVIPCYLSSVTSSQVSQIRTVLHDAINTSELDKIERRKIKAFFQLTQDNEFAYALWGVIRLNMSLPLSYSSLCTTYLVIIIQFSKFID